MTMMTMGNSQGVKWCKYKLSKKKHDSAQDNLERCFFHIQIFSKHILGAKQIFLIQ